MMQKFIKRIILSFLLLKLHIMTEKTIHGKVVAQKTGIYTVYVFQDDEGNYHMCTKLPNWGSEYNLKIGDSGFVTMQEFIGGEQYMIEVLNPTKLLGLLMFILKILLKMQKENDKIIL